MIFRALFKAVCGEVIFKQKLESVKFNLMVSIFKG